MSHVTTIKIEIKDLNALIAACQEHGAIFVRDQKAYNWYGVSVGDYPLPAGITKDQLGKCDHAIKLPGVNYEIGVVRLPNGNYTLAYDFYGGDGPGYGRHDGHKLLQKFGDGCQKLVQSYAVHKATLEARKRGYTVTKKTLPNGAVKLTVNV